MSVSEFPKPLGPPASVSARRRGLRLPSTEELLVLGGDSRIALDAHRAENQYGISPSPDGALALFGSSTASAISEGAFAAAEKARQRFARAPGADALSLAYETEMERIRGELLFHFGTSRASGVEVVFGASGTDLHLITAELVRRASSARTRILVVDGSETGTGVPAALSGRHFSDRTARGHSVASGTSIASDHAPDVRCIPVRLACGAPRSPSDVDDDFDTHARDAVRNGERVLLVLADCTKTGLIAPSPAFVVGLKERLGDRLEVLVDACQLRLGSATVRAYLERDFVVAVTGSKFATGPTFSGALLVPRGAARRFRESPVPRTLAAYTTRGDWPLDWSDLAALDRAPNLGLLIRWAAALHELAAFRAVPEGDVRGFLRAFSSAVGARLSSDPAFQPLTAPALDRAPLGAPSSWDLVPTIFPFRLTGFDETGARCALASDAVARVDELVRSGARPSKGAGPTSRYQLGKPVSGGFADGRATAALRLCASARLVVEATAHGGRGTPAVIARATSALDAAAAVAKNA